MICYQLWTGERAFVATYNKDAADLYTQEQLGNVTSIDVDPGDMPEGQHNEILESDKTIADWLQRVLTRRDVAHQGCPKHDPVAVGAEVYCERCGAQIL